MGNEDAIYGELLEINKTLGEVHGVVTGVKSDVNSIKEHYAKHTDITEAIKAHKKSSHSIDNPNVQFAIKDIIKAGIFVGVVISVIIITVLGYDASFLLNLGQ